MLACKRILRRADWGWEKGGRERAGRQKGREKGRHRCGWPFRKKSTASAGGVLYGLRGVCAIQGCLLCVVALSPPPAAYKGVTLSA